MSEQSTVFVVDDDSAVRESLRWLIESVGLKVKTFGTAREFLDAYAPEQPGCLVLDVRMPGMSGLELQDRLQERSIHLPVIIVTGYGDVPVAVRAMKNGAIDFIEKPFSDQVLLERVHLAIEQDAAYRRISEKRRNIESRLAALTPREREVMYLVVEGRPSREIAVALGLSCRTVEVHRTHLMDKAQVRSVAELARMVTLLALTEGRFNAPVSN